MSVLVPCYKQAHFLAEALASVLAQTFQDWECLVINDGSPDHTSVVAEEWAKRDSRFRYIEKPNGGISSARNRGLLEARGDYIQFLDADDMIEPAKLAWQVNVLRNNPDIGIVYSDLRYFPTNRQQDRRFTLFGPDEPWLEPAWLDPRPILHKFINANLLGVNCPLIRRSVTIRVGLFEEALSTMEDWHYWLRCAASGAVFQFSPAPDTLALVRIHPRSASQDRVQMKRGTYEMAVLVGPLLANKKLRQQNFRRGLDELTTNRWPYCDWQLLRLAWANRGWNIVRPLWAAWLGLHRKFFRKLLFMDKPGKRTSSP